MKNDIDDFSPSQLKRNRPKCKVCKKLSNNLYYQNNQELILAQASQYYEDNKDARKEYRDGRKDEQKEYDEQYYEDHKLEKAEYRKRYNKTHKLQRRIREKNQRLNDRSFALRKSLSEIVRKSLIKNGSSKDGASILDFLPYTFVELKEHLENQFESWMSWNNYGKYDVVSWNDNDPLTWKWQLDHIVPQSKLPYTSMTDDNFKKCWALDNLRPLNSKQNLLDGSKRTRH